MYAIQVGEVTPTTLCKCGCPAELHSVVDEDTCDGVVQYYDACTTQDCPCQLFEEVEE
jgi:hypothetical protein